MWKATPSRLLPTLLLGAATAGLCPGTRAADPPSDEVSVEALFGPQYYAATDNRDSAKFEEFRDVPSGFVLERLLFSWTPRPRWFFNLDAIDVSQDDQRLFFEFGKVDLWQGEIHWVENPRRWTDSAVTLFGNREDALFTLEDSFQAAVRAAPPSSLPGGDADLDGEWDPGSKGFIIDNAIASGGYEVALEHQREQGGAALRYTPNRQWTLGLTADRDRREGTTPQNLGMYFSLAPAEVAAPLAFRTDTATASVQYIARRFNIGLEVIASEFDNGHSALTWDNQLFLVDEAVNATTANPGHGRLTFATDNELLGASVRGGVNLPARTRLDFSMALSETTQDDPFLPMTINSLLTPAPLPATSLDGEYRTSNAQLRLSSRPTLNFRWKAWLRSHEVDNRTPSLTFLDYVVTDYQIPLCGNVNLPCDQNDNNVIDATDRIQRRNLPYGYRRASLGGEVGWSPLDWFDGAVGYEREEVEREHSAVEDASEDSYKLALDFDVAAWLGARATFKRQERRADEYHAHYIEESFPVGEPVVAGFNEGMRRFHWTDRDRDSLSLQLDVVPAERWAIYAETSLHDDDYFDPNTGQPVGSSFTALEDRNFDGTPESYDILLAGRTDSSGAAQSLGISYTSGPRFDFFADYTAERYEYAQASRYRNVVGGIGTDNPLDNWGSTVDDDYETGTAGFFYALTEDRAWTLRGDLSRSEGTSLSRTTFVPGGAASGDTSLTAFPEVDAVLSIATLSLRRVVGPHFDYALRYWFESWKEDNFASDFNEPYMGDPDNDPSLANAMFLGIDFDDYTNHIVSVLLRYQY